jgi:hypothetical protein
MKILTKNHSLEKGVRGIFDISYGRKWEPFRMF